MEARLKGGGCSGGDATFSPQPSTLYCKGLGTCSNEISRQKDQSAAFTLTAVVLHGSDSVGFMAAKGIKMCTKCAIKGRVRNF